MVNRFCYRIIALILSCTLLSSCDDQNFDWDAVHNQSNESLYESLFTSLFGGIDPDQSWDFSEGTKLESTRAANASYYPTISHNADDYYYVQKTTLDWLQENIPESGSSYYTLVNGQKTHKEGISFIMYLPKTGFKITPIYQGKSGMIWDLYMVVDNDTANPIKIWSKSSEAGATNDVGNQVEDFEIQSNGSTCNNCNGTGVVKCTTCHGSGYTSQATSAGIFYKIRVKDSNRSLYQIGLSTNGADVYTLITLNNNKYLYDSSKDRGYYLKYSSSGLTKTYNIEEASVVKLTWTDNNKQFFYLQLDDYYCYIDGNGYIYFSNSKNESSYRLDNKNYSAAVFRPDYITAADKPEDTNVSAALEAASTKCTTCNGTGGTATCSTCKGTGTILTNNWVTVSSLSNGQYYPEDPKNTMTAKAVRAQSMVWGSETYSPLPAYKTVYFYLQITGYQSPSSWDYRTHNADIGQKQSCVNSQMLLLNCPRPTNVPSNHDVKIIGCEDSSKDGSDWDYNDVVFLMEGLPTLPITSLESGSGTTTKTFTVNEKSEKRYMVEDMGFASITGYKANSEASEKTGNSTAVNNNYTDIDFNDIVVDFEQSRTVRHTLTIEDGLVKTDVKAAVADTTTATIRALGGTWDFQLAIGGDSNATPIFQKSLASTSAYNVKNGSTTVQCPEVKFNKEYQLAEGKGIDALDARIMYNTKQPTDSRGDGKYDYNTWIAKITHIGVDGAINKWDATTNNVHFNLIDDSNDSDLTSGSSANVKEGTSTTTSGVTTYHVDFPSIGACPKIIAFPLTKRWQRERVHVSKAWFDDDTHAVNESGNIITE